MKKGAYLISPKGTKYFHDDDDGTDTNLTIKKVTEICHRSFSAAAVCTVNSFLATRKSFNSSLGESGWGACYEAAFSPFICNQISGFIREDAAAQGSKTDVGCSNFRRKPHPTARKGHSNKRFYSSACVLARS